MRCLERGECPVCGQTYYDKERDTVRTDRLSNRGSNHLWAECVQIERGPKDMGQWTVWTYGHAHEQTYGHD